MKADKEKTFIDMTNGSVWRTLVQFALPLVGGSVFQLLYSTTDLLFIGNLVGSKASAAVGASSLLVTCLIGVFTGIAAGTSVAVSQAIGAGNNRGTDSLIHTATGFALTAGMALMLFGEWIAPYVLRIMQTPEDIMAEAIAYIRIYFLGMLPMILYNIGSGILRACGDSRSSFFILAAGGLLNAAVDALLIAILLIRGNERLRLNPRSVRLEKRSLQKILRYGLPAGIQSMVVTLSNVIVQYYINSFGSDTIATFTIYFRLENFTYLPVLAFGQAVMTFTGQNMGAGKPGRIQKGILVSTIASSAAVACIAFFLLAIGPTALGWFGNDEAVIAIGLKIISVSFPLYWLNSLIEVFGGAVRGMGNSLLSMIIVLCSICAGRILLLHILLPGSPSVRVLTSVYPITWAITACLLFPAMLWSLRQLKKSLRLHATGSVKAPGSRR